MFSPNSLQAGALNKSITEAMTDGIIICSRPAERESTDKNLIF